MDVKADASATGSVPLSLGWAVAMLAGLLALLMWPWIAPPLYRWTTAVADKPHTRRNHLTAVLKS